MTRPYRSHSIVAKDIYFNEKHPENHNVMVPNKNKNQMVVKTSNGREFRKKSEVITDICDKSSYIIENQYNKARDNAGKLTQHQQFKIQKFGKFLDKSQNDKDLQKNILGEIELSVLNGQDQCDYSSWAK
jgi:hypothetical protein